MKLTIFAAAILLISASFSAPVKAQTTAQVKPNNYLVQVQPAREQILNACVQNQAATLPNPFTDVPSNHWAYKAVLTMYYCGAYREATPPDLLTNRQFIKVNGKNVNHTKK
ncbi:S-layer protein [Microcoleus sp. N3A4]|uniref:S-layer protein n=1 Tax=Microcoleus sp. N3A4 TaxID=3055379 RepID=UPI002FD62F12